ncbi:MAG TPA: LLM class flavin-dependent oxidoreductase, partial [Dehalococcoidia bacterium]|nr:LLM class flavin-dependent oxidoreductase [Dehalococcoidia bacterium]
MLTKSGLRLGIALPQVFRDGRVDAGLIREFAVRAEALGYEDLWLTERIIGAGDQLEPVTLLTYAAACTQRIRLGVSVIILNQRNPVQLAKALASLDQLSGGRLTVGVGLGGGTSLYPAFGISEDRPVARFTEGLRVLRALWSEEGANLPGPLWRGENVSMAPKPLQEPLPVWLGGHAPGALRRAVRLGNGWMGAGATKNEDFFAEIAEVRRVLKGEGKREANFPLSKRVYISVAADETKAREQLAAGMIGQYGNRRMAEGRGLAGTPKQCAEQLQSMRDAGLTHLLLHPY